MLAFAFKLYYGFVRRLGSVFKQIFGLRGVFKTAFRQNHHLRIAAIVTFKQDCVWKGTAVSARKTIGALNGMLFVCLVKSSLLKGIAVNTRKYAGKLKTVATITSLSLSFAFAYIFAFTPAQSYAATNNTLNFQARLENASGSIAPDGNYNVSFHLFNASSSSGSTDTGCGTDSNCLWSEQYTYNSGAGSSDVRIHVANGYLSVNLGSNTAFPGTINWAQNLYLTMDIGGTSGSSVTWDGQMSPRIQLTGVPYAFQAYSASQLQELQGTYTDTLQFMTDTTQANTITLPDLGGSFGLLALQSSSPGTQQTGNFNISGTGLLNTLDATGSGTANTLTIGAANASTTGGGINLGTNVTTGAVTIGGTGTTGAITLGQTSTGNNTINIGASAGNTYTQTINIGTSTTNGSTSNVNIGPGTSGTATGTTTIAQNAVIGSKAGTTLTVGQNNVPNAKLNVNTGSTVAFRAYQAGTYDVGQFAETGTGVGTVTTNGTTTVTGSSTQFTQYFQVGDVIQIGSVLATVTAISSDTSLTTSVSFGSASGQTYYRGVVGAGTVTTYGTTAIVGSGTSFTTTFQPGDSIMINGESNIGTIASITDNTHLTLYSAAATSASGLSYARYGYDRLDIKANGNVGIGTNNSSAALMIQPTGVGQTGLLLQAANGQTATTALVNVTDSSSNGSNTLLGVNVNSSSSGGTVNVGYTGSSAVSSTANIGTGYGAAQTVNIGNGAISSGNTNVNIGNGSVTGTGAEVVAIGTTSGSNSTTTIQGGNGTGAVGIQAASGGIISIGTNATNPVNIGYSVAPTYVNEAHSNGSGVHTLSFTPTNIGDLVILATKGNLNNRIVSVSGGDVTTWHLVTYNDGVLHEEIWEGVATSTTGGATITANYSTSCSVGGSGCEMVAQEFSSTLGASTNWNVTTAGQQTNSASLTLTYPSLTASENGGLYWGYGYTNGTGAAGSTPGFSYWPIPTTTNVVAYDPTMVKGTTYSPTAVANTGTTVTSDAVAAIITATSSSVNIDGATSLEGPVTSPLMVNSGSNLTNAFQVQNASGVSNFNVDTVHNQVSIGSGAVTTTPNYLYLPDISNNASGNAAITGQWQSSNNWGIGSNSNTGDSILHLGIVTSGTNTWSTTQNLNLLVAGTEEVQPTTGNDSATALQVKNADGESVLQTGTLQTVNSITNYIADSEFALGSGSCPLTDWSVVASATCSQNTTASDSYNGGTSLLLNTTATAGDGVTTTHFTTAPPTTSGGYYTVSFYAMQTSGTPLSGLNLTAAATSGAGNPSNTCTIDGQAANTLNASGFERVVCTIGNFTGVSTIATLKIITSGTVTADTTYISDVQLQSAGSSSAGALSAPLVGQLQLRGVVSTPVALQNSANSSTALQVQNSTGSTIFNVNTNNVNINTSTAGVTGVSSSAPTNVTAVLQQSNSTNPLNSQTYTINTGDRAKGDVIIVSIALASSSVGLDPTTPITGGGVSNWVKVNTNVYGGFNGVGATVVMYEGTVTTVGGTTATVKFNTANPNCWVELISQEFTAGLGANTVWGVTASGTATNTDSSTTVPFPTLTSGSTGSGVYYGYSYITQTTRVDPGTTGFHWFGTPLNSNTVGYNTALTPNTSYSPSTLAPSNTYADSIGVILTPTVDNSVGINGATLVSGAASSAAFQVQNANGSADFNVDTANNAVSVLTGNTGDLSPWQYSSDSTGNNSGLGQNVAVTANGYVYDMTGWDANMIDGKVYYGKVMSNGQIEHMGPTTTSAALVMDQGAVVVNGYVYQLGGATNGTGTATVSTVQYAQINPDGTLGTWHTNAAALPTGGNGVAGAAVVAANGYIYVMGGYYNTTMSSAVYYGKVNADGSVSNWTTSANSEPTALRFASAVYVNGNILLMGGTTGSGSSVATTYTASVNATTGANGAFSTTGNGTMPGSVGVAYATASVVNGYVYLVGGATNDAGASPWYSPVNTVYYGQINSAGNIPTWHTSSQTLPQAAMWQGGVTLNGYLYIIGGYYTPGASPGISANIFYASTARLLVNGSLDLVGATGSDLSSGGDQSSGSSGGMLTAGDTNIVGSLQVADQADFNQGVAVDGDLNVGSILGVDTAAAQVLFGSSQVTNAKLVFENSSNTNTLTLIVGATAASTTVNLPSTMPATSVQQGASYLPLVTYLTADSAASSSTTLADITANGNANDALSFTIPAGKTMNFSLNVDFVSSSASNTAIIGWKCSNASQTSVGTGEVFGATGGAGGGTTTACGTTAATIVSGPTSSGSTNPALSIVTGTVKANAGASTTITFEYARSGSGVTTTTVKAGSYVQWWQ